MRRLALAAAGAVGGALTVLLGQVVTGSSTPGSVATSRAATAPAVADGTVTGATVDTHFGPVQVAVTFSGNHITDVRAVQTPAVHHRSVEINQYAVPILRQEVLAAQSANIAMVTGATFTSQGYISSLQSALTQAGW